MSFLHTKKLNPTSQISNSKLNLHIQPKYAFQKSNSQQAENRDVVQLVGNSHGFDFQNIPIQPKLKISQPDDPYEKEADRVANQIMRMSNSNVISNPESQIHSKCSSCNRGEGESKIHRKFHSSSELETSEQTANEINSSIGRPLDESTKSFMEPRFGYDFSDVKIHDNPKANRLSGEIGARAFTTNNNIFIGENESVSDKRLLAHELVHVIQQNSAVTNTLNKSSNLLKKNYPHIEGTINKKIIQRDPVAIAGLGLAVASSIAAAAPYGNSGYRWTRNILKAVHDWSKVPASRRPVRTWSLDRSIGILSIDAISGASIAWAMWNVVRNYNGYDLDQAHVNDIGHSTWAGGFSGSSLNVTFEMQDASASYEKGSVGALICYISGTLDPAGSGDIAFNGRVLITADGNTRRLGSLNITRGDSDDFEITNHYAGWKIKKK